MNKLRVGFSPDDLIWSKQDFRELLKSIQKDEGSELFLITKEEISFASLVQAELDIDDDHFFRYDTNQEIIQQLVDSKVLIFLSNDGVLNKEINDETPLLLEPNNVTGTQAINVNNVWDEYKIQYKYYTYLKFWTDQINKYDKKGA